MQHFIIIVLSVLFAAAPPLAAFDESASPEPDDHLRILVWNIQRAAAAFENGPEKTLAVIRDAQPDICLLQESYDIEGPHPTLGRWLAGELGWNAYQGDSPHLCIITPFELIETHMHEPWHAIGARVQDDAGRELIVYSTWIDSAAYLPYHLRDQPEATDEELLACESERSGRLKQARAIIDHLEARGELSSQTPLLVGGDWNSPSHLDWTEDAARVFRLRRALPLPVSGLMFDHGFVDAFRHVHPDPVHHPGFTWSPLYRGTDEEPATTDRIDRLYVKTDALEPLHAAVLPSEPELGVAEAHRSFPSDHGAVVIDLHWKNEDPQR